MVGIWTMTEDEIEARFSALEARLELKMNQKFEQLHGHITGLKKDMSDILKMKKEITGLLDTMRASNLMFRFARFVATIIAAALAALATVKGLLH